MHIPPPQGRSPWGGFSKYWGKMHYEEKMILWKWTEW
jgi:hypothetical protein